MAKIILFLLLISTIWAFVPPCSELTDIPESIEDLVPVSMKEGKPEIHVYRKYFITKRGDGDTHKNPFSETVWTIDADKDMLLRMRVQSPNTNFKISLTSTNGDVLADAASVLGFGASISSLITKDKLAGDNKAQIKFHFYDFLKTPEEIIEHEDVHDCHLPHIVLEMSIMSKEEFVARKEKYNQEFPKDTEDSFPYFDQDNIGYEDGVEQSAKVSNSDNFYSLKKTESTDKGKFQILKEYQFRIDSQELQKSNPETQELLYYLQLVLTYDFMTSGSLHVVVAHQKDNINTKEQLFQYDSLNCAEEQNCVVSQKTNKNEESFHIALTEGDYVLYFIDYQNEGMRNFIADAVPKIPFSSVMYFYPVEAQDNSIYCEGLAIPNPYFVPYEISDKSLFDQRIEIDLRNSTQDMYFQVASTTPTFVRITTEQDIGMDVDIKVFDGNKNLIGEGKDIGSTETVVVKVQGPLLMKVQLNFRNSIIRDLTSCPQLHFYVNSISEGNAKKIGDKQKNLLAQDHNSFNQIESVLGKMQSAIESGQSYTNSDEFDFIYVFPRESYSNMEENVYENKLTNTKNQAYWVYFEIFSDQVFNDVVVNMDFDDRRFTKTSTIEEKLVEGQTDQLLRSQKALHVFSMVMSYQDTYNIKFLSRNMLGNITGFDESLSHVMFQMRVHINPIGKQIPLSMTSLPVPNFSNLRDLGIEGIRYSEMNYYREHILLANYNQNKIVFTAPKDSKMRIYLKSLINGVSIKSIDILDEAGQKLKSTIIEKTFEEYDVRFSFPSEQKYTLIMETRAKKKTFSDFFIKLEVEDKIDRSSCKNPKLPNFNEIAVKSKRSDSTQESHYFVGNSMFRNIYHLGQRQVGVIRGINQINLPTAEGKNYAVIPFSLTSASNLLTANLFHEWSEFLVKLYIIPKNEDPQDLFEIIRSQKSQGDHSNIPNIASIYQSKILEYFDGIEKQFLPMGDYQLVIMNLDPSTDGKNSQCLFFTLSIYIEEELKKKESKPKSGFLMSSYDEVDDSLDEAVIESMTLCQNTFIFNEIYRNLIKVNGGVLSIDSVYRFDNDERTKRVMFELDTNSVIYVRVTDLLGQIQELEVSLNVLQPNKKNPSDDNVKVVSNKKAEKSLFKHIEIQQFVKKGKYQLDLSKSIFDVNTDLFPCNKLKLEIEVRPLKDIPDTLKDVSKCNELTTQREKTPVFAEPSKYNELIRIDDYFPITQNIEKNFIFKVKEPMFLIIMASFEKEISGGALDLRIAHVNKKNGEAISSDKKNMIQTLFTTDTFDGTLFAHERLEPYLSGDMKLDSPGEYAVSIRSENSAKLTKTLQNNKLVPKCSKVSFYYQLLKISDLKETYDEEFAASTGGMDASNDNCKNIEIDEVAEVNKHLEKMRTSSSLDLSTNVLIPDPTGKKKIGFLLRSSNKPTMSIVKISASLPENIMASTNLKFHLRVLEVEGKDTTDLKKEDALKMNDREVAFLIDDTMDKNYYISIEFEEIDFDLLQTF